MEIKDYYEELLSISNQKKALDKREKEIKADIKKQYDGGVTKEFGLVQVQYTEPYYTFEFDEEKFEEENPELFDKYLKQVYKSSVSRIVLIKNKEK